MTARHWRQKPPKVGDIVTASTGRKKETRFAVLKVTGVYVWDGRMSGESAAESTGLSLAEIAKREGFETWYDFCHSYYSLNAGKFLDSKRTHYFISFELVKPLIEGEAVK